MTFSIKSILMKSSSIKISLFKNDDTIRCRNYSMIKFSLDKYKKILGFIVMSLTKMKKLAGTMRIMILI